MWYPGCLQLVAKMYAYPFNSVISCSWMLGTLHSNDVHLLDEFGWFHELSSLQVLHLFSDIWKSLIKLWACRNPEQQIVLTFLGVCLLLVQWPSGCDLWPVRSGRVLDSGLFGWGRFLCPRLKCRRLSAAVRREVMKCLKPRRQRWSLSQLDFSFRTVCFAASFMATKSDWWSVFTANSAKKSHTEQSSASGSVVTSCFCQHLLTTAVNSYKNMSSGRFGASSSHACFYISFWLLVMFLKYLQSQECYLFHDQKHDKHGSCRKLYLVGVTETVSSTRLWTSWLENI